MMIRIFTQNYITSISVCLASILVSLGTTNAVTGFFGFFGMLIFFILGAHVTSRIKNISSFPSAVSWHSIGIAAIFLLSLTSIYFLHAITKGIIAMLFVCFAAIFIFLYYITKSHNDIPDTRHSTIFVRRSDLLSIPVLGCQIALFFSLFQKSTTLALGSPWLLVGPKFFLVYGLSLACLFFYIWHSKASLFRHIVIGISYFLTFSVVAIIYTLGFGYDPFLHRAAEQEIITRGVITPKTPFYIGQYAGITLLSHITHIPLFYLDTWLVPILTASALPLSIWYSLRYGYCLSVRMSHIGSLLALLYPFSVFFVTTPHNVATLITLIVFFLISVATRYSSFSIIIILFSILAFSVHPLSGVFALLGTVFFLLSHLKHRCSSFSYYFLYVVTIIGSSVLLPTLFFTYLASNGVSIPPLFTIVDRFSYFTSLFARPYYFINRPDASLLLDALYIYQPLIPIVVILCSVWGWRAQKNLRHLVFVSIAVGSNMFFLSTWVVISSLNNFEQLQYAERLRHIIIFPILPFFLYTVLCAIHRYKRQWLFLLLGAITTATLLTASWYLTYPQRNEKIHFPGYNVTAADKEAATYIHTAGMGQTYVVLSNPLTAAASIELFGFDRYYATPAGSLFYYSVPSGSPLAIAYGDMLYKGQQRKTIDDVMELTGVDTVYFLVHAYWHDAKHIIEGATKTADSYERIQNGAITIFQYTKK